MPARRSAIRSTRRGSSCAARSKSLGADCIEKEMRTEHKTELLRSCSSRRHQRRRSSLDEFKRYGSARKLYHFHVDNVGEPTESTISRTATDSTDRRRASRRPSTITRSSEIRRAAATGIYDIRGGGAKRRLPHFDDLLFLGASISRYPLEGYRERCGTDVVLGTRFAKKPIAAQDPDHHRRHELRLAVGAGQGGAGPRRDSRSAPRPPPATAA